MRLERQSKMGFYTTPPRQVALIKTWLSGQNACLMDLCCGKGEVLGRILNYYYRASGCPSTILN